CEYLIAQFEGQVGTDLGNGVDWHRFLRSTRIALEGLFAFFTAVGQVEGETVAVTGSRRRRDARGKAAEVGIRAGSGLALGTPLAPKRWDLSPWVAGSPLSPTRKKLIAPSNWSAWLDNSSLVAAISSAAAAFRWITTCNCCRAVLICCAPTFCSLLA